VAFKNQPRAGHGAFASTLHRMKLRAVLSDHERISRKIFRLPMNGQHEPSLQQRLQHQPELLFGYRARRLGRDVEP
jgi:hypothetical protein